MRALPHEALAKLPTDHGAHDLVSTDLPSRPGGYLGAVSQHRDPIRDRKHLFEPVIHKDDTSAPFL